ncbi:hypothetical protein WR25_21208 isoform C [Diploscapter pachys]|uniref:CX domain-containing protein n=1 Tax=Diploscapter pachys TaxID=2018661 RepID=A0A2A2KXW9_9BILA|nr:hypothetical protein WR25_21208 isoform C [Diploscapter pachys]
MFSNHSHLRGANDFLQGRSRRYVNLPLFPQKVKNLGGRGHSSGRSHSSSHSRSSSSRKFSYKTSTTGSIERTSLFRSTVFGGRYLSFAAGRHIIVAPAQPIIFDKRHYYWDSSYINPNETYPTVCVNKIDPQDPQFGRVFYENETKPKEIAYGCEDEEAYCCGYECCEESGVFTGLL